MINQGDCQHGHAIIVGTDYDPAFAKQGADMVIPLSCPHCNKRWFRRYAFANGTSYEIVISEADSILPKRTW